jgi:hypothetical protein
LEEGDELARTVSFLGAGVDLAILADIDLLTRLSVPCRTYS